MATRYIRLHQRVTFLLQGLKVNENKYIRAWHNRPKKSMGKFISWDIESFCYFLQIMVLNVEYLTPWVYDN